MADRVDLLGIRDEIRAIFDAANTTTASPIYLSSNLSGNAKVRKVLAVRPDRIPLQASFYPYVTCYIDRKEVDGADIAKDQLSANRMALVKINVVGGVFNDTNTGPENDPPDIDINYLMENVELVLRSNPSLNGKVLWQRPDGVEYFSASNNQKHLRIGVLSVTARVKY